MKVNKIGLFGGTFNPIHNGHIYIAQAFMQQIHLDNLIFIPAGEPYHKQNTEVSALQRLEMVELAIAEYSDFSVSDCDIIRDGNTYTFDTVKFFENKFPHSQLWWLLGSDSLETLHTWYRWQDLVQNIHIAIAMRVEHHLENISKQLRTWLYESLDNGRVVILKTPLLNISSTAIRQKIQMKENIDKCVPIPIIHYIQQNHLYQI